MLSDVGDQTKASGSNPSASIIVTPTAPNPMTVTLACVLS
jgi:hypothetical protein